MRTHEPDGHDFREKNGTVDYFAYDGDTHNGPECLTCGESWCEHCERSYRNRDVYAEACPMATDRLL